MQRHRLTYLLLALALTLPACDLSEDTDTYTAGPGLPVYVTLAVDVLDADCGGDAYLVEATARVHNATVPGILELTWGDGASASIEGTTLTARHTYRACGLPGVEGEGWLARATVTLSDGGQAFADRVVAVCAGC